MADMSREIKVNSLTIQKAEYDSWIVSMIYWNDDHKIEFSIQSSILGNAILGAYKKLITEKISYTDAEEFIKNCLINSQFEWNKGIDSLLEPIALLNEYSRYYNVLKKFNGYAWKYTILDSYDGSETDHYSEEDTIRQLLENGVDAIHAVEKIVEAKMNRIRAEDEI